MKARELLARSAFDPAQVKTMGQAFEDAWQQIAPQISARAEAIDAARHKLAQLVLSLAKRGILDREKIKDEALRLMRQAPAARK
jgi:hypothetical protein